jgi:alpha-methylacyl-CoA racemase
LLAWGIAAALYERAQSGEGQTIDAAMVDAATLMMSGIWQRESEGRWMPEPGTNDIDSGAPFYEMYGTKDGEYMAVACIEPKFYAAFVAVLGMEKELSGDQWDRTAWPARKQLIARRFAERTRAEWCALDVVNACVTPVNRLDEVSDDRHVVARQTLENRHGGTHPAPAPRLSRTPLSAPLSQRPSLVTVADALADW